MRQVGLLIVTVALMAVTAGAATAAPPTCSNPAVTCYTGTAEDGSTFKAEVPPDWNGTLLLYSRGYVPPFLPNPPADTWRNRTGADHLLGDGFALADLRRLARGRRVAPELRATACRARNVVHDGRISVPVLTVHATADGLVVSPHENAYAEAVRRAGRTRLLKQLWVDRPGHCTFTDAEAVARRLVKGPRPDPERSEWVDSRPLGGVTRQGGRLSA